VDFSSLTKPVTRDEIRAFKRQSRANGVAWITVQALFGIFSGGIIAFVVVIMCVSLVMNFRESDHIGVTSVVPIVIIAVFAAIAFTTYRSTFGRNVWRTRVRLSRFAADNGLVYSAQSGDPAYPGAIFGIGTDRTVTNHVRSVKGRYFDIGSYGYVTGSGKSRQNHNWGFMALALDRSLPHMVLDSKANNRLFGTNLPAAFSKDQVLSLEGDFDRYFTLYCPREYERDALYVFTPDLMALLIDEAAPYDVEIVDKWMFVYSSRPFTSVALDDYQRMGRIIETVGAKTLSQTDYYADDRVGDRSANIIAPQGRRLKRGIPVVAIVACVIVATIWIVPQIAQIFEN